MKKYIYSITAFLLILLLPAAALHATSRPGGKKGLYFCFSRTGGSVGALDALDITGIGSPNDYDLADGDVAITIAGDGMTVHTFDADGTNAESDPDYIRPDDYVSAGVWVRDDSFLTQSAAEALFEAIMTAASQAEMEAGTGTNIRSMTPQRIFQAIAAWAAANGQFRHLTAEPTDEALFDFAVAEEPWSTDPPDNTGCTGSGTPDSCCTGSGTGTCAGLGLSQDSVVMCISPGTPGTWVPIYGANGSIYIEIPLYTATYASTDTIESEHLFNYHLNNYGQSSDATLTLDTAEDGMNSLFEIVDVSNALLFEPPSGEVLMFVDSDGVKHTGSANQGVSCPAAGNEDGDELIFTTKQTGASTYIHKIKQTVGDGCALE